MPPRWERRWPGLLQDELDALVKAGATYTIDPAAATVDILVLHIDWPLGDRTVRLRAVYPDTFPRTRPWVYGERLSSGRHVDPIDGGVCLLGRGTHNWSSKVPLATVLEQQLGRAIAASADPASEQTAIDEEHDGIPAEEWWNRCAPKGSFALIDTDWTIPPSHDHGKLKLRYNLSESRDGLAVRAVVEKITAPDGTVLARWDNALPLPPELRSAPAMTVPWARAAQTPLPKSRPPLDLSEPLNTHPSFARYQLQPIASPKGFKAVCHCVLYRTELGWRSYGDGWLFLFSFATPADRNIATTYVLRTLRAGPRDVGGRVPAVAGLKGKRVAIFGVGAIGAPIAVEMARNGCGELRVIEQDLVEPGNTVRWPLGTSVWGQMKAETLAEFIGREYPATRVLWHIHSVGSVPPPGLPIDLDRTGDVLDRTLDGADLVIDATAERGINWLLDDLCRERRVPLITAHATPTLEAGVVARFCYMAGSGCRMCLEHAWLTEGIPAPRGVGAGDDALPHQAPGCAERTFLGASFDLAEISLQAVRLAVDTLVDTPVYPAGSCVQIVSFTDAQGKRVPPTWQSFPLVPHRACENLHQ